MSPSLLAAELHHTSTLRLLLLSDLLSLGEVTVEEAAARAAYPQSDVVACLEPLVRWGVAVRTAGDGYRLADDLSAADRATLEGQLAAHASRLGRHRQVRHQLLGGWVGHDPRMQLVLEQARQLARLDVPVLIHGERGCGADLIARAIHDLGPRRNGFFGALGCGSGPDEVIGSQLFGHGSPGALFTGLLERCDEGTLLLEDVEQLGAQAQVDLLEVLLDGSFTPRGLGAPRRTGARLIAATEVELGALVAPGRFREDLYFQLVVAPLRLPTLRERLGDLPELVRGILAVHAPRFHTGVPAITEAALARLRRYHWPGNVRELETTVVRAAVMAGGDDIGPEHLVEIELLSDYPQQSELPPPFDDEPSSVRTLDDVERDHITHVLRRLRGNIKATAESLGISRTTLYKKIRQYGIDDE